MESIIGGLLIIMTAFILSTIITGGFFYFIYSILKQAFEEGE